MSIFGWPSASVPAGAARRGAPHDGAHDFGHQEERFDRWRNGVFFARQVRDLILHFALPMDRYPTNAAYRAASAMNLVLGIEAAEIAGVEEPAASRQSPYRPFGERLHGILRGTTTPGAAGDQEVVDRWAGELGLRERCRWAGWMGAEASSGPPGHGPSPS